MIQSLSNRYKHQTAWMLFIIFYLQILTPMLAKADEDYTPMEYYNYGSSKTKPTTVNNHAVHFGAGVENRKNNAGRKANGYNKPAKLSIKNAKVLLAPTKTNIGGPSAPEASSFKAVGSNNLVNLSTGDFSYSIPLLDVGGYPVNLFYSGGVTMDQEASWVGLGWNINPGTVNRNMRGVPDDFDGTDQMLQTQNVKPNRTWGGEIGADVEIIGLKKPLSLDVGASVGFSYNNYLGPALEIGGKVSMSITTMKNVEGEKAAPASLGVTAALGAKLSSRSGLTFSPSLNANVSLTHLHTQVGVGISTSYNSRSGIKDINIHSEMKISGNDQKFKMYNGKESSTTPSMGIPIGSTTISFAKPSYLPALRMPMQNANYSGQIEIGGAFWGIRGAGTIQGYYSESLVPDELKSISKPLVGYIYAEKAVGNANAVMDFNRLGDAEVTPNTPIISAPQYNYDVFSIQGEGTGGSIRAYRGDMGFVRDNVTTSKEKNVSIGVDIGIPFHYGVNVNIIKTPTRVGGWDDAGNKLNQALAFRAKQSKTSFENVYFKNPGESTVTNSDLINRIGKDNLVRFQLGGSSVNSTIEPQLEQFDKRTVANKAGLVNVNNNITPAIRDKRTQVITMLNAGDASKIGLDKYINNTTGAFDANNNISVQGLPRVDAIKKAHHISQIDVLEQTGMRYVYGLPVYSLKQKDFTFSVDALPANGYNNLVSHNNNEPTIYSEHMGNKARLDGYVQTQETPGYASSFLLSGLLSPDYVDVTGDGITEDDLGTSVKFGYNQSATHKWRTPRSNAAANLAHFNEGIRTEKKDNKASISYGEREVWYLSTIESKSMIAIFKTDMRDDAKGVKGELDGTINTIENANKRLVQIDLYTKSEIKSKGYANAKPIKSVIFNYDYSLCTGTPDNKITGGGKLTLKSIYFSYNGQPKSNKDRYVFNYGNTASQKDNPSYSYNAADRWGTYKPALDSLGAANNPSALTNLDYPYTLSSTSLLDSKPKDDIYAAAWSLKKILLPSGGQMEVQYEADDYGYVQNRRACNMMNIAGLGKTTNFAANSNMYSGSDKANDNNYVYIALPQPLTSTTAIKQRDEIYAKYLDGVNQVGGKRQLVMKLQIYMPKGLEPLTVYPEYDDYGVCPNNSSYMYVRLKTVDGNSPLVNSSLGFLTENIPGQAFPGYDVDVDGVQAFLEVAGAMLTNLTNAFQNVNQQMRTGLDAPKGKDIALANSFIRLANPTKTKYGGGIRVKSVKVRDNWNKMTGQYSSVYGQDYDYSTMETIYGVPTTISSGVASYEPGIGSEENPFREIVSFSNQMPLASAQYGAIEMPMLEGLYPSPNVVYSKVTVRSVHRKGTHADSTLRSAIGKQVTEFYTAKDYPSYSSFTPMNTIDYNKNPFFSFFYKEIINRRTVSQGFLVETNDMHGKMKSQMAFSESDENTPLSASYHTYKNTGKNGLNDKVDFVYNNLLGVSGAVSAGNMGVDMELMTDVREYSIKSNGLNGQGQVDIFTIPIPLPPLILYIPIPTYFPLRTYTENIYRAVTCTKLINYHAIEDSVIVMDKGSVISTKTIAYDAETGNPIVIKTANEFNDPIFNVSYPAYWAYSGTGLAYKNIGRRIEGASFSDGRITLPSTITETPSDIFESGDELYITNPSGTTVTCVSPSASATNKIWAFDKNKNTTALTVPVKDFIFMDNVGALYTMGSATITIVRSGKRNNLGLTVSAATAMKNPIQNGVLQISNPANIVSASAIEFKEKWQTDKDAFNRYIDIANPAACTVSQVLDCNGYLEKSINPYIKGLVGNYKPYRSYTYYGDRAETDPTATTAIRKNGYILNFGNYWNFNANNNLIPDANNTKWVWNSELTKVNAKGQELETKDALNRYTAAQYGFYKNMPVAMIQNAHYGESFGEGFEDVTYKERINAGVQDSCLNNKYMTFLNATNASIISTTTLIKPHSGNSMMMVNTNTTAVKQLNVNSSIIDSYNFIVKPDTVRALANIGGNTGTITYSNYTSNFPTGPAFSNGGIGATQQPGGIDSQGYYNHTFDVPFSYYVNITNIGSYNLNLSAKLNLRGTDDIFSFQYGVGISFSIRDLNNILIGYYSTPPPPPPAVANPALAGVTNFTGLVYLCPGIYKINGNFGNYYRTLTLSSKNCLFSTFSFTNNFGSQCYQSLTTANGCITTRPIPATDSMLNPNFALVPGKRMQFSAWVQEDCAVPCGKTDYTLSNTEIWANGANIPGSLIKRTGNIIDGWQKIEGEFTIPAGTTSAEIHFVNGNSAPMYVDDIRIHPFNANMKSYVYDARPLRLSAELDENNYASFYEYDEEGQLVRVKKETIQGVKTIKETRSAKQKLVVDVQ
jgi:hypothetical protein